MKKRSVFILKLVFLALCALILAAVYVFRFPCPIKAVTGIPCPGCGMTHAYLRLLRLDFAGAFSENPLFWLLPLAMILLLKDGAVFKNKRLNGAFIFSVAFLAALSYAVRLFGFFIM